MSLEEQIPWTPSNDEFDDLWDHSPWASKQPDSVPDMLSTMFEQQKQHMAKYAEIMGDKLALSSHLFGEIDSRPVQAKLRETASYTVEELYEAIGNLKNKPWKQSDKPTNIAEFREELADAWHFFIELHVIAGLEPIDVFRDYFRKSFINKQRIASGY